MSSPRRRAVVLLSGGLDSTTTLATARAEGFDCYALTVDYGQRHQVELEAARRVAQALGAREHAVLQVDLRRFGGSALTADPRSRPTKPSYCSFTAARQRSTRLFMSRATAS